MHALPANLVEVHLAWAALDAAPLRACVLCKHSRDCASNCGHPSAALPGRTMTTQQARGADGICGPNAVLMLSPWLG